jgi:hypothetical protein
MPPSVALAGDGLMALGSLGVFFVFKENTFTSATIELAPDHQVISTRPYAWVRHPMYLSGLVLLLGIPIALGSWWGILAPRRHPAGADLAIDRRGTISGARSAGVRGVPAVGAVPADPGGVVRRYSL